MWVAREEFTHARSGECTRDGWIKWAVWDINGRPLEVGEKPWQEVWQILAKRFQNEMVQGWCETRINVLQIWVQKNKKNKYAFHSIAVSAFTITVVLSGFILIVLHCYIVITFFSALGFGRFCIINLYCIFFSLLWFIVLWPLMWNASVRNNQLHMRRTVGE